MKVFGYSNGRMVSNGSKLQKYFCGLRKELKERKGVDMDQESHYVHSKRWEDNSGYIVVKHDDESIGSELCKELVCRWNAHSILLAELSKAKNMLEAISHCGTNECSDCRHQAHEHNMSIQEVFRKIHKDEV